MDWVNQALARAARFVQAMSPSSRMTALVALAVVVACLAWIGSDQMAEPETYLMGGERFSAAQLRSMETAFGKAGLTDYQLDAGRIRVAQSQQARYMAALGEAEALPADFGQHLREAVSGSGFLVYGSRQEAQTKVAIQSDLQSVICRMSGVENASVHIAEETTRGLRPQKTVTASVALLPRAGQSIDDATVVAVRQLVASTWGASLKPEAVTVLDLSTNRTYAGSGGDAPPSSDYAAQKKQLELDWQDKVNRLLNIPGALVAANVELDPQARAPRGVSLSVAVPEQHFEQIWHRQHPSATATPQPQEMQAIVRDETARIKAVVLPLLSTAPGSDRAAQIAISTIQAPVPPQAARGVELRDRATEWLLVHWQSLGVGCVLILGLWILRGTLKTAQAPPGVESMPREGLSLVTDGPHEASPPEHEPAAASPPQDPWREELAGIVRQDPRAAASVLKTWIGNAG